MPVRTRADAIDTRWVFRIYAALAGCSGFAIFAWGPWFVGLGLHLAEQPWGKAALVRMAGACLMAAACFALALAGVEDPVSRRRGLLWAAAAHGVVFAVAGTQRIAIWGPGLSDAVVAFAGGTALLLLYLGLTAEGEASVPGRREWPNLLFRSSTARLRSLYQAQILEAAGQEERKRLARDLHDSVKQQIFAIQTAAATAEVRFASDPAGAREAIRQVRGAARDAMTEMEVMLEQLRAVPLENSGLVAALKKSGEALQLRTGAEVVFKAGELPPADAFPPGAHQAVFRAAQEALSNIARHARATHVHISLSAPAGRLELRIEDDGAGVIPGHETGMGIRNMRERAEEFGGEFEMSGSPGGGTRILFRIPYLKEDSKQYRAKTFNYGAIFVLWTAQAIFLGFSWQFAVIAAYAGVGFVRAARAWYRVRRREHGDASDCTRR